MSMMRQSWVFLILVLLSTPLISGQSICTYRKFSLGESLASVSKQIGREPAQAEAIQQHPATIQHLLYWPYSASSRSARTESVSQIRSSFYVRELYKIAVSYDEEAESPKLENEVDRQKRQANDLDAARRKTSRLFISSR